MINNKRQKEVLRLIKQGKTQAQIAKLFNVTRQRISQLKNKKYFQSRKINCLACNKRFTIFTPKNKFCNGCSKHLSNIDGRERSREIVRIRDKYRCQKCGLKWDENMRRFDIHHLNGDCGKYSRGYDKIKNIDNLITMCHKCHLNLDEVKDKMRNKSSPRPNKPK